MKCISTGFAYENDELLPTTDRFRGKPILIPERIKHCLS